MGYLKHVSRITYGNVEISNPDNDKVENYDTLMCVHCGMHWTPIQGSGRKRGFCLNCMGVTCGQRPCMVDCVPYEKMIEGMERR